METTAYSEIVFVGRETELNDLRNYIFGDSESQRNFIYVHGEGGIGKTQLLKEYIDQLVDNPVLYNEVAFNKELIDLQTSINQDEKLVLEDILRQLDLEPMDLESHR